MATTLSGFRTAHPELAEATYGDDAVEAALKAARSIHQVTDEGGYLCAAHILTEAKLKTRTRGEVTMEMIGQRQTMYAAQARHRNDEWFTSTPYGKLLLVVEQRLAESALPISIA